MAYSKVCPACGKISFCASREGKWICPYCGRDLTSVEVKEGGDSNE